MPKYQLVSEYKGYVHKRDETNLNDGGYLVVGSQNVVSTDGDTIAIRQGYDILGAENPALTPVISSYEWQTHRGVELAFRKYGTVLEVWWSAAIGGNDSWETVMTGLTDEAMVQFTEWWDQATEKQDFLLFVQGNSNIYMYSGGITTYASSTTNTITKQGVTTWAEEGFLTAGTRQVIIGGITYTYTGGEATTTLTGVTPDPTLGGHTAGDFASQAVRVTSNKPTSGYNNDFIATLNNYVWIGSKTSRDLYMSKNTDYTTFTFSSPRLPGEGALLTLDQVCSGFSVEDQSMYISSGKHFWFKSLFTLSADNTKETLTVERLKTAPYQASIQQSSIGKIKNFTVYISNEPVLNYLGFVEQVVTPQTTPISDPIKIDFDTYDFTDSHIMFYNSNLYITVPANNLLLTYNIEKGFWEAPWTLPAGRLAIIAGELCIHSNSVPETYKLFQGYNDYGSPINAIARFAYNNYGMRMNKKNQTEWCTEGYIASNTKLKNRLIFDYKGSRGITSATIDGSDTSIIYQPVSDGSLGKTSLGKSVLGGGGEEILKSKFRVVKVSSKQDYFEIQPEYSSNAEDQYWEIISFGPDVTASSNLNYEIKQ